MPTAQYMLVECVTPEETEQQVLPSQSPFSGRWQSQDSNTHSKACAHDLLSEAGLLLCVVVEMLTDTEASCVNLFFHPPVDPVTLWACTCDGDLGGEPSP